MIRRSIAAWLLLSAGCGGNGGGAPGAQPTPPPENLAADAFAVKSGYGDLAWGASRAQVLQSVDGAKPSAKNPDVLVRETKFEDLWPATEAYFFGEKGLEEVEIRIAPKRSPQEAASLGMALDRKFRGTHETSLADDQMYQLAWFGEDTDVRLTYDLRESATWGPVVTYAVRNAPRATPAPSGGGAVTPAAGGPPGRNFANAIRGARKSGLHLTGASAEPGRLTLIYGDATKGFEIIVTSDPKTGALLGYAELPRSPRKGLQRGAEAMLDKELLTSDVTKLTFGGKAGLENLVTVHFGGRHLQLDPKAPDILVGGSYASPASP